MIAKYKWIHIQSLKSPIFPALNTKCYNTLTLFWIFYCILRVWVIRLGQTQKLHENSGNIFGKVRIVCASNAINLNLFWITDSERNKIDSWVVTVEL